MTKLQMARRRLGEIAIDCEQLAVEADHKGDARAWRAIAAIANAGLSESAAPAVVVIGDHGTGGAT